VSIPYLDNIFWHSLSGPQLQFSSGTAVARRFATGFSPIVAFADRETPDFPALAPFCAPGEQFYCEGWSGSAPEGWQVEMETTMVRMVWNGAAAPGDEAHEAVALGPEHIAQALELTNLTKPGPFGPRTIELGEYFGMFEGTRLVAMAGERTCAPGLREISGVCTHPDVQGRGMARRLVAKLVGRELQRKETPFLHVMRDNTGARTLYRRMGFVDYLETVVRVVSRR
jgi:ribosomal protein S18 acetylase RimI-like enzyme